MNIKNFDPYDFSKKEINGVPVYYKNLPSAPCINVRIVFNTGAFHDPAGKEGITHFLEHMLLKGCPSIPSKKAVREWAKINTLNTLNAATSFHNIWFTLKCLPENYENVLVGLKDMIFNSYLKADVFEDERKVITQEAWGRFFNEKYLKYIKEFSQNLFHGHEHARFGSPLGWPETIAQISREDAISWHKNNFGIGNMFIILTGAVEEKHIESLSGFLKDLPKVDKISKIEALIGKPKQKRFVKTADEIGEIKEQVEMSIIRVGEKRPYLENEIANVYSKLVYDLLHERLRTEHSLCYGVNVSIWREKTYSQVFMNVKTEEKNIELVEKEFKNIIDEIIDKKHINRFDLIKKMYIEQLRSLEVLSDVMAGEALRDISKYGKISTQAEVIDEAEKVSYDDIIKFSKWAFDPECVYTEIILPSKK